MQKALEKFAIERISSDTLLQIDEPRYTQALDLVNKNKEKLLKKLNFEEKELLDRFVIAQEELNQLDVIYNFVHGYQQGLVMTAESFLGMTKRILPEEL